MKILRAKMRSGAAGKGRCALAGGAAVLLLAASAQAKSGDAAAGATPAPAAMVSPSAPSGRPAIEVLKVIDDPSTGTRWLVTRDPAHPGGPGRLLSAAEVQGGWRLVTAAEASGSSRSSLAPARTLPVIRIGDRLLVEEHTAVADATLEAIALSQALPGAPLDVRLKLGGKVLRVYAAGPGRALLQPPAEVKP